MDQVRNSSSVEIHKSYEDPHNLHNNDIVVDDSVKFVGTHHSFDRNTVPDYRQTGLEVDNRNHNGHHSHKTHNTISNDQINSNIKFDSFKGNVNSGSVEKDTHVPDLCAIEKLARNAYQEAEKQQIFAQIVQKQNTHLTSQLEMYKEQKQDQSQLVRDRDIIRDLKKQRDKLDLEVTNYKRKNEELQKTNSILKRQISEKEDTYHDTILDLEAKLKKNVDLILKLGNSLQRMFMLGPKPLSVYDEQLKHGFGYSNPYTLKQVNSKCPKLYVATSLGNLEIPLNVKDSEDTLEDAFKSQQKMKEKMNDPIAVANKQNCWTINYKQLNALYEDFVPQKELSVEQKYFPSSSIPSVKILNCKRASIFYTSPAEIQINDFCQDQVKPILNELKVYLEFFRNLFQRDIKEMKDVFESTKSELDELKKQNDLLKDQFLEASLKHDVELCVLLNHECIDKILNDELQQVKKKSFEIQEGLQARIKILEKDVQRCQKQSVDFELTFSTNSRTPKSSETTFVAPKTRFSKKETQSKTLDTTPVVSKSKIDVESASKAKDKVSSMSRIKKRNLRDKPLSTFIKNKIQTSRIWQKWFESQPNVIWTPVNIKLNVHNTRTSKKPSVSVKKWVVKLPICPCVVSSCVAEYFEKKFSDTPINSAAQPTLFHEDSLSTSSIIVDEHEVPPIVTTSNEHTSPISLTEAVELNQEDSADFDGNSQFVSYNPPSCEEIGSSTTDIEPSNV
ncbi:hypothetical protein Tco_1273424 [Tanacetum coccineum]